MPLQPFLEVWSLEVLMSERKASVSRVSQEYAYSISLFTLLCINSPVRLLWQSRKRSWGKFGLFQYPELKQMVPPA
jgi:hypothetical protein